MGMKDREKNFFMEGTLRICGSLEIEKALGGGKSMDMTIEWSDEMVCWLESDSFPRNVIANKADEHPIFVPAFGRGTGVGPS